MYDRQKISVIIITLNEEKNIAKCLESISWADEIILVDTGSTDETLQIAQKYHKIKIFNIEWMGFAGSKKYALSQTSNDWILWVDADEEIPFELKKEIMALPLSETKMFAYQMPRKTYFMGEWVRYSDWYPGYVTRLFNKNYVDFNNMALHEHVECPQGKLGTLKADIIHYSYQNVFQYFDKLNKYGLDGAKALIQRKKRFNVFMMLASPTAAFIKYYFLKLGFLDGIKGLIIALGSSYSRFVKYVYLYYMLLRHTTKDIK
ncbi:MAG: glycosyltransferase family 2 protein [Cytophagales bacterium]|nr:glycosyltransferase family 2 protein [Cytophagales bacterium]